MIACMLVATHNNYKLANDNYALVPISVFHVLNNL